VAPRRSRPRPRPGRASETDVIAVSDFKARCLEILETLRATGHEVTLTRHGDPIARVVPITSRPRPLRGLLKSELEILGDIVETDSSDDWEVNR
jgi:prevent-host-death family protein